RLAFGTSQDDGPIHHACRGGGGRTKPQSGRAPVAARSGVDVFPNLLPAARISRRRRGGCHCLHGCALYIPQIRQGEKHEPGQTVMKILHLDSGRQMRGGQWQALYLMVGQKTMGLDPVLLAPSKSPLAAEAAKRSITCHALNLWSVAT